MHAKLQDAIAVSRRAPYRHLAQALGVVQVLVLALAALVLKSVRRLHPDAVDRALAEAYYYVPEMALHKKIELQAYLDCEFSGRGIDLGCGSGIVGGILAANSGSGALHGVDLNAAAAELAKGNGYSGFTTADLAEIDLPDASFDFAISICVLEHVANLAAALREARRLLRPGGRLIFSTPAPNYRRSLVGYRLRATLGMTAAAERFADERDLYSIHLHYMEAAEWKTRLGEVGFRDIRVSPIFSRRQLALYDMMNFQVYMPRLYFADKLQALCWRFVRLRRLASWATMVFTAAATSRRATEADGTHFFIVAQY
ncbi:MAG TPA: class I SAM-dependent methyltransferase [Stellaceae bacterium]|nr:class I SAM-dependent methyltransferase [Stellaceae bacterium]